jgi:hypothetical protein
VGILDTWVEDGFINAEQREAIAELISDVTDGSYDSGYEYGWDEGYHAARTELEETMKDSWFQQGWEEALIEHGIEE